MRKSVRGLAALAAAAGLVLAVAACGSSSTTSDNNVSLAGSYTLKNFSYAGQDLSQLATGTAVLTATNYSVDITVSGPSPMALVDSGTYTATQSGTFTQTSSVLGTQATGTYTNTGGILTVSITVSGLPVVQTWQKN